MSLTSRQVVRERLATLLTATGVYKAVYDYPEKKLRQQSPVAIVAPYSVSREFTTADFDTTNFYLEVIHLVKRDDSSTYADTLDALELNLVQTLRTNLTDANWSLIEYDERSEVRWGDLEGVPYVMESFIVRIEVKP